MQADRWVFLSGQRPVRPSNGEIPENFRAQAEQVFANLQACLAAAGCSAADVVKVQIYVADLAQFDELNEIYRAVFTEPYPARTTVQAILRGIQIEVDCIAVRSSPAA